MSAMVKEYDVEQHLLLDGIGYDILPVKIFTLGRFLLIKDGKLINFTRSAQNKPLMMLKVLIALGGCDVPEGRLTDILWEDSEGDQAHQNFSTTLFRLRQLLGDKDVMRLTNHQLTLDPGQCYVDVWELERLLEKVDQFPGLDIDEDSVRTIERALALYKGHFLKGYEDHPWTVSMRERLRLKLFRQICRIGFFFDNNGQPERAIDYYEKGLEIDDLAEEFYRRLMACYRQHGRISEALSVYRRCRHVLSANLGIPPSQETELMFQRLT